MKMNKYTTIITGFFLFLISCSASAQFESFFSHKPIDLFLDIPVPKAPDEFLLT